MKQMIIQENKEDYDNILNFKNKSQYLYLPVKSFTIFYVLNILIIIYLIIQDSLNKKEIKNLKKILKHDSKKEKDILDSKIVNNYDNISIDIDMIGLNYPEINFNRIKSNLLKNHLLPKSILYDFLEQLEIKLIYLEK